MPNRDQLRRILLEVAEESSAIDVDGIDGDADLFDLGVDSLQFAMMLVEVEERLGEDLPTEAFDRLAELQTATLDGIVNALAGPTGSAPGLRPL